MLLRSCWRIFFNAEECLIEGLFLCLRDIFCFWCIDDFELSIKLSSLLYVHSHCGETPETILLTQAIPTLNNSSRHRRYP
jgi:hypothetical protein